MDDSDDLYYPRIVKRDRKKQQSRKKKVKKPEPVLRIPREWYAGKEKDDFQYTWKSQLNELSERIQVQTAILIKTLQNGKRFMSEPDTLKMDGVILRLKQYAFLKPEYARVFTFLSTIDKGQIPTCAYPQSKIPRSMITIDNGVEVPSVMIKDLTPKQYARLQVPNDLKQCMQQIPVVSKTYEDSYNDLGLLKRTIEECHFSLAASNVILLSIRLVENYQMQQICRNRLLKLIQSDTDPYAGHYHPAPYSTRTCLLVSDYMACHEMSDDRKRMVEKELDSETEICCDGRCNCGMTTMLDPYSGHYKSSCPCARSNYGCGPKCPCYVKGEKCHCGNPISSKYTLQLGSDYTITDSWGIDCYTRTLIQAILQLLRFSTEQIEEYVQLSLLRVIRELPSPVAHDMRNALIALISRNTEVLPSVVLLQSFMHFGPNHFRVHPKGKGVVCIRPGGIPASTPISPYFGEVYPSWYWFEKQDVLKAYLKSISMEDTLPEFYNIVMERPLDSKEGYGVLFVDPIFYGNVSSRLSHSCHPNCATMNVGCECHHYPRVSIRNIQRGEELTFDYSCVSEKREEFEKAVCLCGSSYCRGSFVAYADSNSFMQALALYNSFIRRCANLIECSQGVVDVSVKTYLHDNGIRSAVLEGCPDWLIRFIYIVIHYMHFEEKVLPDYLVEMHDKKGNWVYRDRQAAEMEVKGVYMSRLQNLVISVDKVKHILSLQPSSLTSTPPMQVIDEDTALEYLWFDENSVIKRLCRYMLFGDLPLGNEEKTAFQQLWKDTKDELFRTYKDKVRPRMQEFCMVLYRLGTSYHPYHIVCADLLLLYIHTKLFFTITEYAPVKGDPVSIHVYDVPCSCDASYKIGSAGNYEIGEAEEVEWDRSGYVGEEAKESADEMRWKRMTQEDRIREAGRTLHTASKGYNSFYIYGQLMNWFKQSLPEPSLVLKGEKRGCFCLPDLECAYQNFCTSASLYIDIERDKLISALQMYPTQPWTISGYTYKNPLQIYGSPLLDAASGDCHGLEEALQIMTSYPNFPQDNVEKKFSIEGLQRINFPLWD